MSILQAWWEQRGWSDVSEQPRYLVWKKQTVTHKHTHPHWFFAASLLCLLRFQLCPQTNEPWCSNYRVSEDVNTADPAAQIRGTIQQD